MFNKILICFLLPRYWILLSQSCTQKLNCSNLKLNGGRQRFEGTVQLTYNGTVVNICADSIDDPTIEQLCGCVRENERSRFRTKKYDKNVFNVTFQDNSLRLNSCEFNSTCQNEEDSASCCRAASICCYDDINAKEQCSANWTTSTKESLPSYYVHVQAYEVFHLENMTTRNQNLSWTASSLQLLGNYSINGPKRDLLRNCTSYCFDSTPSLRYVVIGAGDQTPPCMCKYSVPSATITVYEVMKHNSITCVCNTSDCLAAIVRDGKPTIVPEDCGLFLPKFVVQKDEVNASTTTQETTHETGKNRQDSSSPRSSSTKKGDFHMIDLIVMILVLVVAAVLAVSCFIYSKMKKIRRERQRPNSVSNRTYAQEFLQRMDEENYALINTVSESLETNSIFKPQLPPRKSINIQRIEALDEYSSPSDMIQMEEPLEFVAEYSTTYDDPLRQRRSNEHVHPSDTRKDCDHDLDKQEMDHCLLICETADDDKNKHNSGVVIEQFDIKTSYEEGKRPNDMAINNTKTFLKEGASKVNTTFDNGCPSEYEVNTKIPFESTGSDYEDTDIIDGHFPSKSLLTRGDGDYEGTDITDERHHGQQHICLNCLPQEHMDRLGIEIIQDDNISKNNENVEKTIPKTTMCDIDSAQLIDSAGTALNNSRTERKCTTYHAAYDSTARVRQNRWHKMTDNEYDKFC